MVSYHYDSHYKHNEIRAQKKQCPLTALESPHPGAIAHIHTISVPLNWATLVQCLHESSFVTVLHTSACCTLDDIFWILMPIMLRWSLDSRGAGGGWETIVSLGMA